MYKRHIRLDQTKCGAIQDKLLILIVAKASHKTLRYYILYL